MLKYKRVLFKVSGESLMGNKPFGLDIESIKKTCEEIVKIHKAGAELSIVVGGGNIFRGVSTASELINRANADYIGMLATVMNGIAIQSGIEKLGVQTRVMSALAMTGVCETYTLRRALHNLDKGYINIFVSGTGNPYFTTDTASVLRSTEMQCDVMLKGTQVDGVYDKDPKKHNDAVRFDAISFDEAIKRDLRVLDPTALTLARDNNMPIVVFKISEKDAFLQTIKGTGKYTIINKLGQK